LSTIRVALQPVDMARRRQRQLELGLRTWGGRRKGAGRKPAGPRPRVVHGRRAGLRREHPVLVTMRIADGLPSLRSAAAWATIVAALRRARERFGLRVIEYSVLGNHLHFIVEARDRESLIRGLRGLTTRLAKQLNKTWKRRGKVFPHRYHSRILTTPREVRNALAYVLLNRRHHEHATRWKADARRAPPRPMPPPEIDRRSSGARFDGWREAPQGLERDADFGTVPARTWLLRVGWRRHGLLGLEEIPGVGPPARA